MKKLFVVLTLLLVVFVAVYRQRLFVWDPIAHVTRDGGNDPDARVRINYTNDLLLDDRPSPDRPGGGRRLYLVQNWDKAVIAPAKLTCLGSFVCMTEADQAGGDPVIAGSRGRREPFAGVTMTNRRVEFVDEDGALVEVVLR